MAPEKRSSGACGQSQERERFFASTGTGRGTGKRNQTRRPAADGLGHTVLPISNTRMVSCAGDLLLVILRRGSAHQSVADIYKLECAPEPGRPPELGDRATDLANHSLFLARSENFALSAKEFPAIRRNHVYYLEFDGDYSGSYDHAWPDWAFVFDLGSGTLKKIPYPGEFRDEGSHS